MALRVHCAASPLYVAGHSSEAQMHQYFPSDLIGVRLFAALTVIFLSLSTAHGQDGDPSEELIRAARIGDLAAVRSSIARGADVNVEFAGLDATTPLMDAACHDHAEVIEVLLRAGAQIDKAQHDGFTALLFATAEREQGNRWRRASS